MPHITVVIPVYNHAHFIGRTIESVLKQTFEDFDLLVVDDASCDNTASVVKQYCDQDSRIRLEVNPKNLGLTRNWNRCLDLAQGPLVQILQSDDLIDPGYLMLVSGIFERHPGVGMVAASCRHIDADDRVILSGVSRDDRYYRAGDEAVTALLTSGYPHVSSIVFRRECYEKVGKFDERIWHGPDMEMDARIVSEYDYYRIGAVCTSFRRHGTNMGQLEYLRNDFLEVDILKRKMTLGHLSARGLKNSGIEDLDQYIQRVTAQSALRGIPITIAYGRYSLSRYYLREALRLDKQIWRNSLFWKALVLLAVPPLGRRIMTWRMKVNTEDQSSVHIVETSLHNLPEGE